MVGTRCIRRKLIRGGLSFLITICLALGAISQSAKEQSTVGRLVVIVSSSDNEHTPARDAYVAVQGYPFTVHYSGTTTVLTQTEPGHYEALLPAGLYDIEVSEAQSYPQCERVEITPGQKQTWVVKLKTDFGHLEK